MMEVVVFLVFFWGMVLICLQSSPLNIYTGIVPFFIIACSVFLYPRTILILAILSMCIYSITVVGQIMDWFPVPEHYPARIALPLSLFIVNFMIITGTLMAFIVSSELLSRRRLLESIMKRYRTLMDAAPDPIIVWDPKGRITMANPAACKFLGYEAESDLVGKTGADILPPDRLEEGNRNFREDLRTQQSRILEFEFIKITGERLPVELHITPIREDKTLIGVLGICRDVSERIKAEQEQSALQQKVILQDKMASLGRLVMGIAHEYNNVFAGLRGYAQLALMPGKENRLRELPKITIDMVDRAQSVTEGLLSFSGRFQPDSNRIRPSELIGGIIRVLRKEFERLGIQVELDIPEDAEIATDVSKLQHAMLNLITNACDAMPKGGKLGIRYFTRNNKSIFEVEDGGYGIPEDILPHIFDPFFTTKGIMAAGGDQWLGLGLSTCYSIVQGLGGDIFVESEVGKGTKFRIELPL